MASKGTLAKTTFGFGVGIADQRQEEAVRPSTCRRDLGRPPDAQYRTDGRNAPDGS